MIGKIKEITNIDHYNSAYELIDENCDREFWEANDFDEDDLCFLRHFDDFEGYTYYIFNYEYVLATISGDPCGNDMITLDEFVEITMQLLREDRENR